MQGTRLTAAEMIQHMIAVLEMLEDHDDMVNHDDLCRAFEALDHVEDHLLDRLDDE